MNTYPHYPTNLTDEQWHVLQFLLPTITVSLVNMTSGSDRPGDVRSVDGIELVQPISEPMIVRITVRHGPSRVGRKFSDTMQAAKPTSWKLLWSLRWSAPSSASGVSG